MYGHVPRYLHCTHNDIAFYIISTDGVVFFDLEGREKNKNIKCAVVKGMKQVQEEGGGCSKTERGSSQPARFLESVAMKYYYRETAAAIAPARRRRDANHTRIPRADDTYQRVHARRISCREY